MNTENIDNVKLKLATIWNWGPIVASYSTNEGTSWTTLTKGTVEYEANPWQYFTYVETLPKAANLWIKIEKQDKTSGMTQVDDITIFAPKAEAKPIVTFNMGDLGVDIAAPLTASTNKGVYRAIDGSIVTDATAFFVLKEGGSSGEDVAFTATLDAAKTKFTITPSVTLKPTTNYYIALKNRVVADADGVRAALTEKTFKTGTDTLTLRSWLDEAERILSEAPQEGIRNGDQTVGSKETFQGQIDASLSIMRNPASEQAEIDLEVTIIQEAIATFQSSVVQVDYEQLESTLSTARAKIREADNYLPDGIANLQTEYNAAFEVGENDKATQAEVDAAKAALQEAINALIPISNEEGYISNSYISPNPAGNHIQINGAEDTQVTLYSADGAKIMEIGNYNGGTIDINALAAGTYLVKADGKTISFIKK